LSNTQPPENPTEDLKQLGSYAIESRLGQGGMGIVYRATDKHLGRTIAIKVLHPHLLQHDNLKQRFRREARMHGKLMHGNIVTLLSLFEDEHHMALVMEFVDGLDLKAYLKENPNISLKTKLHIASEILLGLDAAHQFGMVHRDLKPANVLVSNQGEIKLLDFGLAKPEQGDDDLTQSGATVGSFRYMSPEQILNKPIDARTDLYAFGILLFYMVVGKLPFDATSSGGEFEIMEKQVREPAPVPHQLDSNIPISLSDLIVKLLNKDKHHRPKNASIVRDEILSITNALQRPTLHQNKPQVEEPITFETPNNKEIAQQWVTYGSKHLKQLWLTVSPAIKLLFSGLTGIAFVFVFLGFFVISMLNMAEDNALQYKAQIKLKPASAAKKDNKTHAKTHTVKSKHDESKVKPTPQTKQTIIAEKTKETPVKQEKTSSKTKPKIKTVHNVEKIRKKIKKTTFITDHARYSIERNDGSTTSSKKHNEFNRGNHLFFEQLAEKSWLSSSKRGESILTFEQPTSISKIILHKASVGRKNFKHGFVYLEVQSPDSKRWKRLFERKGDDVDIAVTINDVQDYVPFIKTIRIRFKTADPITIGPIDLIK